MSRIFLFYCYCTSSFGGEKVCACIFVCVYMCVHVYCVSLCACVVCTHVCRPDDKVRYLDTLIRHPLLHPPETGSLTGPGACCVSARLTNHAGLSLPLSPSQPLIPSCPPTGTGVTNMHCHTWLLLGCWGSELRPSCFHGKHCCNPSTHGSNSSDSAPPPPFKLQSSGPGPRGQADV